MASLEMIFNILARDGASPQFRTVGAEAKILQRTMEEADAKMASASKAASAEMNTAFKSMAAMHRDMAKTIIADDDAMVSVTKASAVEMKAANDKLAASMAASTKAMAASSREAAAAVAKADAEMGAASTAAAKKTEEASIAHKKSMMNFGLASALAVTAVIGESVKMAADFQQKTSILVTAAGESTKAIGHVRSGILDLAASTGTSWKSLADGAYILEKAGYRDADMLHILKAGAQAAAEEGANLTTVVGATSAVMHDYHLPVSDAVAVTNGLKAAAGEAKSTFEQFDAALGTVVPLAANAKISFADVSGVLAEMTQHGISADEAAQQIANSMRNLVAPNMVAQKMMAQLGISVNDVTTRVGDGPGGRGLAGTLQYLSETVLKHMGPSGLVLLNTFNQSKMAADDARTMFARLSPEAQKLADSFLKGEIGVGAFRKTAKGLPGEMGILAAQWLVTTGNAHGFQQALRNGTNQSKTYNDMMKTMTGGANGLNVALNTTMGNADGTNESIKRVAASMKNAGTDVQGWQIQQGNFNQKMHELRGESDKLMIQLGTALLPALTKVMGVLADHPGAVKALAFGIGTLLVAATAAWTVALLANPAALIAVALVGLAAAVVYCWEHFKTFRTVIVDVFHVVADVIAAVVTGIIQMMGFLIHEVLNTAHGFMQALLWMAEASDKLFGTHIAKGVRQGMDSFDAFSRGVDQNVKDSVNSVNNLRDQANSAFQKLADNTDRHSSAVGASVAQMASHVVNSMGSMDNLHANMKVTATGEVLMGDLPAQVQQELHLAEGGPVPMLFGARRGADSVRALLMPDEHVLNVSDVQAAGGHEGVMAWRNSLHMAAGGPVGANINFADQATAPIDAGLARFEGSAVGAIGHGVERLMKTIDQHIGDAMARAAAAAASAGGGFMAQVGNGTDIVNDARRYLGQPYQIGGDPYGSGPTDCSGLVDRVMADLGHRLPGRPLTYGLVNMGQAINYADALPGDLVFTNYNEGGIPGPGHVGIYEGGGRMIDDPNPSSHVREESVWETPGAVRRLLVDHLPTAAAQAVNGNWADVVYQALKMENLPASAAGGVLRLIQSESGGDANAQNNWDSNARAGTPSQGLMQLIPGTFAANHWPGTSDNIRDPLANIAAGINYAVRTYGINMLMGGGRHDGTGRYVGYANGGMPPIGRPVWVGEQGPERVVFGEQARVMSHRDSMAPAGGVTVTTGDVHIRQESDLDLLAHKLDFLQRAGSF